MVNQLIIKKEVKNLKENLESIENMDVEMNKLHDRIYNLKMSILAIDEQLHNYDATFSSLRKDTFQKLVSLLDLREAYMFELKNLEVLL